MESAFIISDYSNWLIKLIKELDFNDQQILEYEEMHEDWEFDNWVTKKIPLKARALIIPIELGKNNSTSIDGLRIGMHLRLLSSEAKMRGLPILFLSNREQSQINQLGRNSRDKNHYDYLIGTKGTDLLPPIASDILSVLENLKPLEDQEYKVDFYDHIKILPPDRLGKHSIANIWGAFKLAEITGHQEKLRTSVELLKKQKELYFKSINAISANHSNSGKIVVKQQTIPSTNKQILLIDDEANKGWSIVLESVFKDSKFMTVSKAEHDSFEAFYKKSTEEALKVGADNLPKWDLILLDLRLDETEDLGDATFKTAKEYSGGKLLLEIKKANRGTQVIMFTASNKAWNMRELLDMWANGFYIKESPEYNQDDLFSLRNYGSLVSQSLECFENGYLKEIWNTSKGIVQKLLSLSNAGGGGGLMGLSKMKLKNEIEIQSETAYELLTQASKNEMNYSMAFLSYFKILELINDYFIEFDDVSSQLKFKEGGKVLDYCRFESGTYKFTSQNRWNPFEAPTTVKLYNIFNHVLGIDAIANRNFYQGIYKHNELRKKMIHPSDMANYQKAEKEDCRKIAKDISFIISRLS